MGTGQGNWGALHRGLGTLSRSTVGQEYPCPRTMRDPPKARTRVCMRKFMGRWRGMWGEEGGAREKEGGHVKGKDCW